MSDYNIRAVITAVDRGFSSVLGQAQASLNKFGENAASSTKSASDKVNTLNSSFKSMASAIGVMQLVSKAISVVGNSVGSAVKRVDTLANAQRVFQNMGFSAQQSSTMMERLKASINGLPTALDDAVSGVQMLAASTGDLGKSQKVYSALNDSIIGFGGSTADIKNAVLQLSQAFANGKIDGMTWISMMNSQMGPVLTALAKKFGMTTGELQDALSAGKISVGEFQDALIELDSKGGGGLASLHQIALDATSGIGTSMENAKTAVTRGLAGIINAINTGLQAANLPTISQMIAQVGTAAENVLSKIAAAVPGVISSLASFTGGLQPLQPLIKGVVVALAGLVGMILASSQINATIMLFKNLGTAIGALSNPITAVVVVIGLIAIAFMKAYNSSETFRNAINAIGSALGRIISSIASGLKPAIDGVVQGFNSMGASSAIINAIKVALATMVGILGQVAIAVAGAVQKFLEFGNATGLFKLLGVVIGGVADAVSFLIPAVASVVSAFMAIKMVTAPLTAVKAALGLFGPVITQVVGIASKMETTFISAFNGIKTAIGVVKTAWSGLTALFAMNPFAVVLVATAAVVAALAYFFTQTELGKQVWSSFMSFMGSVWNTISSTAQAVWTAITSFLSTTWQTIVTTAQTIWQGIVSFFTGLWNGILAVATAVWNAITTAIQTAITVVSTVITTVLSTIQSVWSSIWNAVSSVASSVWDAIKSAVSSAINAVSSVISSVMNAISSTMSSIWNAVKSVTSSVWNGIKSAVSSAINAIRSVVTSVMNAVRSVVTSVWNSIRSAVSSAVNTIRSVVSSGFNAVRSAVSSGMNGAVNAVRSAVSGMVGAGRDMISGLVNGIRSGMSWVVNAARNVARAAVNAAKAALHIGSPSKIMRDKIGKWIPAGVGVGIDRNLGWITNATDGMRQAAMFEVPSPDMSPLANGLNQVRAMTSQSIGTSLNSTIDHELSVTSQPAYINLSLGGSDYTTYVADISKEQGNQASLSRYRI